MNAIEAELTGVTLSTKPGVPQADTYVVCLDCGDQLSYDWNRMRIGERIEPPVPPHTEPPPLTPIRQKLHAGRPAYRE